MHVVHAFTLATKRPHNQNIYLKLLCQLNQGLTGALSL